jgi:hypothetical protein
LQLLLQAFWKQEEKEGHHWLIVCNFWTEEEHNMADSWDPFVLLKKAGGVEEEQEAEKW